MALTNAQINPQQLQFTMNLINKALVTGWEIRIIGDYLGYNWYGLFYNGVQVENGGQGSLKAIADNCYIADSLGIAETSLVAVPLDDWQEIGLFYQNF